MRSQALAREVRVWERVEHPNVLGLVGFYSDQTNFDIAWLLTEWQENGDVLVYIERTNANLEKRLQLVR